MKHLKKYKNYKLIKESNTDKRLDNGQYYVFHTFADKNKNTLNDAEKEAVQKIQRYFDQLEEYYAIDIYYLYILRNLINFDSKKDLNLDIETYLSDPNNETEQVNIWNIKSIIEHYDKIDEEDFENSQFWQNIKKEFEKEFEKFKENQTLVDDDEYLKALVDFFVKNNTYELATQLGHDFIYLMQEGQYEHYDLKTYTIPLFSEGKYNEVAWAIGTESEADDALWDYYESLIDDVGYGDNADWYLDEEQFISDYIDNDGDYYRELIEESPEDYDIPKAIDEKELELYTALHEYSEELYYNKSIDYLDEEEFEDEFPNIDNDLDILKKFVEKYEIKNVKRTIDKKDSAWLIPDINLKFDDKTYEDIKKYVIENALIPLLSFIYEPYEFDKYIKDKTSIKEYIILLATDMSAINDEIEEKKDNIEETDEYDEDAIDEKVEELLEDKRNEVRRNGVSDYIENYWGFKPGDIDYNNMIEKYIDKDKYIKSLVDESDYGELNGYDGTYDEYNYEGENYVIINYDR